MKNFNRLKAGFIVVLVLSILAVAVSAVLLSNSPTVCSGKWSVCTNAFVNDGFRASGTASSTSNISGIWKNYGFSIPSSAKIDSVKVRADFFASNFRGFIKVMVSGDNGATYGPEHIVGGNTAEQTFNIDVTSDLSWTPAKLSNANFRVNVTCFKSGSGTNPQCLLDWVPVNVTYTPFDFSISRNPVFGTVETGGNIQTTVTVNYLGGISQNVNLAVNNCPVGVTCTFNQSSGIPTYSAILTMTANASAIPGFYNINISGAGDGITKNTFYSLGVCSRGNPAVSISPATQAGTAGSTLVYQTNVTNTDSASCGISTIQLTNAVPPGWNGIFGSGANQSSVMNVSLSGGKSQVLNFSATSDAGATAGNYTFSNTATNLNSPSFVGSNSAVYEVI